MSQPQFGVTVMNQANSILHRSSRCRWMRAALFTAACSGLGPAAAQEALRHDVHHFAALAQARTPDRFADLHAGSRFSLVELPAAGPSQRPRRALRMRFDGATRAMRSLGVQAEGCTSLLRSSTSLRSAQPGGEERLRVSVSVALSCRFF